MVRYAILGLLREHRDYGYRLKRRFDERVGTTWQLNMGQVYQTLRSLQRAGLITEVDGAEEAQAARRLFDLTPKGLHSLDRWLTRSPRRVRPVRDEILIRFLILRPEQRLEALSRVAEQQQLYKRHLARLVALKTRLPSPSGENVLLRRLGLEAALLHTEAHLKWLDHCRDALEPTLHPSATEGPRGR